VLAVLLLCACLPGLGGPARASTSDSARAEADRQITFARAEVAESRFDRALTSAESALRLCPDCREATLLKALAYDGLGDRKIAVRLLESYKAGAPEADRAKADRILAWFEKTPRTRPPGMALSKGFAGIARYAVPSKELDAAPYAERLAAALEEERCAAAAVAAAEWIRASPDDAEAHRRAADAAICTGDARFAARLLARWTALGVDDPDARARLESVAAGAASLTITPSTGSEGWTWLLDAGGEWIGGTQVDGGVKFAPLAPEVETVVVGFAPGAAEAGVRHSVAPLSPAEHRTLEAPSPPGAP